ncbi:hypothetical protein N0V94_004384 [Neodidymelliopsis sp. IMI 364377]|nr:hypothetical protein N0V94_004384 [Neodidymelliopsis sp. IMI 364377]
MHTPHHHKSTSGLPHSTTSSSTNGASIVLLGTFVSFLAFLLICVIANYMIRTYDNYNNGPNIERDLETGRPLLSEENLRTYQATASSSHELIVRDRHTRRVERQERFQDTVASMYQMSVRAFETEGSEESNSSDEGGEGRDKQQSERVTEEHAGESSESDSSESEDSYEEEGIEEQGQEGIAAVPKPTVLPKRVSILRSLG